METKYQILAFYLLELGSGVISFMGFFCFPNGHDIQLFIYRSNQESGNLKQDFDAMLYCVPILSICSTDLTTFHVFFNYFYFSNKRGGWNKRGGGAKVAKSLNVKVGITCIPIHKKTAQKLF